MRLEGRRGACSAKVNTGFAIRTRAIQRFLAAHPSRLARRCKCTARLAPPATTAKPLRGDDRLRYDSAFPRRDASEFCKNRSPRNQRAQGMPGAQCTRSLACEIKKHTSVVTTVTPEITRHSPRNGFTAYFAL